MKIKVNQKYAKHGDMMKSLALEFPELEVKVKDRKWGLEKPSFKYKKNLYEFDHEDELIDQVRKIMRLKNGEYGKKSKNHVKDIEPAEQDFEEDRLPMKEDK